MSLKGMPNGRFAKEQKFLWWKQLFFTLAGKKFDNLAKKNNQEYLC